MALLDSLRRLVRRGWRKFTRVALFHPEEPADSVSIPRRPVATGPLPTASGDPADAPTGNLQTAVKSVQHPRPEGPLPTIQPHPDPDALPCVATIRAGLGTLNVRSGPGLTFPRIERAAGGMQLGAAGQSGPDQDGHPWYWVNWVDGSGWVRSDFVTLRGTCAALAEAAPQQVEPPYSGGSADPGDRWPLPVDGPLIQGYHNAHPAYDLAAPPGTRVKAGGPGVIIRRMDCATSQDEQTAEQFKAVFDGPEWGFGDGSYLIVRHDYDDLPEDLRREMDTQNLAGGYAYVQLAHLDRLDASLENIVTAGTVLGTTGLTGASAGPTLHLAVKIGREEKVDDLWSELQPVHPGLLYYLEPAGE